MEHLTEEDMPPQWMWPLAEQLEDHFEKVKERRKSKYDSGPDDDEDEVNAPMIRNEYARGRGREAAGNGH